MSSSRGCGNMGKAALGLFHIPVAGFCILTDCSFSQSLLEFRDGRPECRVPSDSVVIALNVVERRASRFIHRVEYLHIDLGLES